jgi:hypothetical protein
MRASVSAHAAAVKIALIGVAGFGSVHRECLALMQKEGLRQWIASADPVLDRVRNL